jgi:hypothetical protein
LAPTTCAVTGMHFVFSYPRHFNKRVQTGPWELIYGVPEFQTPPGWLSILGNLVHCMWRRFVVREEAWTRVWMEIWTCTHCDRTWSFGKFATSD